MVKRHISRGLPRFLLGGLLVAIALVACLVAWLRPVSQQAAERIATDDFLEIPGGSAWGEYRVRSFLAGHKSRARWVVNFVRPSSGALLAQTLVDRNGRLVTRFHGPPGQGYFIPSHLQETPVAGLALNGKLPASRGIRDGN